LRKTLSEQTFFTGSEDVVGQGGPLVENKIEIFQTCFLKTTEEKEALSYAYFGNTSPDGKLSWGAPDVFHGGDEGIGAPPLLKLLLGSFGNTSSGGELS
jgi:hypothetical protein